MVTRKKDSTSQKNTYSPKAYVEDKYAKIMTVTMTALSDIDRAVSDTTLTEAQRLTAVAGLSSRAKQEVAQWL